MNTVRRDEAGRLIGAYAKAKMGDAAKDAGYATAGFVSAAPLKYMPTGHSPARSDNACAITGASEAYAASSFGTS